MCWRACVGGCLCMFVWVNVRLWPLLPEEAGGLWRRGEDLPRLCPHSSRIAGAHVGRTANIPDQSPCARCCGATRGLRRVLLSGSCLSRGKTHAYVCSCKDSSERDCGAQKTVVASVSPRHTPGTHAYLYVHICTCVPVLESYCVVMWGTHCPGFYPRQVAAALRPHH